MGSLVAIGYLISMIGVKENPENIKDELGRLARFTENRPLQYSLSLVSGGKSCQGIHLARARSNPSILA